MNQLKPYFLLVIVFFVFKNTVYSQAVNQTAIRIKIKPEAERRFSNPTTFSMTRQGNLRMGISDFDQACATYSAVSIKRVFRDGGKFEKRRRRHGLHLWYELTFRADSGQDNAKRLESYKSLGDVEISEAVYEKTFDLIKGVEPKVIRVEKPLNSMSSHDVGLNYTPNDPMYAQQWHYNNTGQTDGLMDADIDLPEAWNVQKGSAQVIVSIHDEGIEYDHEDIAANMWVNEAEASGTPGVDDDGNGYVDDVYGYNLADDQGDISPGNHGTHVGGTVAAVNNNDIGVAGVAGGSNNSDGVRLMSCQVFGIAYDGFAESYAYAADNGAVISQNSWGYTSPGFYEQAVLDGIDYFIEYAGYDEEGNPSGPMQGGIVIFAAGNDGSSADYYPGYYAPTFAVASTNHEDQLSWYSNYGDWVDISAPGGETSISTEGVLSALTGDSYGFYQGTSMACPHVSGLAALIVSEFAGDITPFELRARITATADDIDDLNDGYEGLLGAGRINASASLLTDEGIAPDAIVDLESLNVRFDEVLLSWTAPEDEDNGSASSYEIRYSTSAINDINFEDATLAAIVVANESGTTEELWIDGLDPSTSYHLAMKARDFFSNESNLSNVISFTTTEPPVASVSPDNIAIEMYSGDLETTTLNISNTGSSDLIFELAYQTETSEDVQERAEYNIQEHVHPGRGQTDTRQGRPVLGSSGEDGTFGYSWKDSDEINGPVFDWEDITESGIEIVLTLDDFETVDLPFEFPFYDEEKNSVNISSHAFLTFNVNGAAAYVNGPIPNSNFPNDMIALFWSDVFTGSGGSVHYLSEPGQFIVQYTNLTHFSYGGNFTFQVILYPSGNIKMQYLTLDGTTTFNTIGVENSTGTDGLEIAYNTSYVKEDLAIEIELPLNYISDFSPQSGVLEPGVSTDVEVLIDANGMFAGVYEGEIVVSSNDPVNPEIVVPLELSIDGAPNLSIETEELNFGETFITGSSSISLNIFNSGTDNLIISSFTVNNEDFQIAEEELTILPDNVYELVVSFSPSIEEEIAGSLTILSNDPNNEEQVISLVGVGALPPIIELSALEFEEDLFTNETAQQSLSLSNTGSSNLEFEFSVNYTSSNIEPEVIERQLTQLVDGWNNSNERASNRIEGSHPYAVGDFHQLTSSQYPLTCLAIDPSTGFIYAQQNQGRDFFRYLPDTDEWETLASGPLNSGNNGGAAYLDGKIYTVYTSQSAMGVYDIAGNTWETISSQNIYTGNITSWNGQVFVASPNQFLSYNPTSDVWTELDLPDIPFEAWGGISYFDGYIYGHSGNATTNFRRYNLSENTWEELSSMPGGSVLGSTIDEIGGVYYAYGSYSGNTLYAYDFTEEEWSLATIPYFLVGDGGLVYSPRNDQAGIYMVQGELGTGFARFELEAANRWLSIDSDVSVVLPDASTDVMLNFDATGMYGGIYQADLVISNNDPINAELTVPITLNVTGVPDLAISATSLNFQDAFVGYDSELTLILENVGTDVLEINGIDIEGAGISYSDYESSMNPGNGQELLVTISPTVTGEIDGLLTIFSNDHDEPEIDVTLSGLVEEAPQLEASPSAIAVELDMDETEMTSFEIRNLGDSDLSYEIILVDENIDLEEISTVIYNPSEHKAPTKRDPDKRVGNPVLASSGNDGQPFGYSWLDSDEDNGPVFNWIDIGELGTQISFGDDDYESADLPFDFTFYDEDYTSVYITSNGLLAFNSTGATSYSNYYIPYSSYPNEFIAMFWDDLYPPAGGDVYYYGTSEYFIVQFDNINHINGSGSYTFQAILYPSGNIKLQYLDLNGTTTSCTIGVEDPTGLEGMEIAYNTAYLKDNFAIQINAPGNIVSSVNPSEGTVSPGEFATIELEMSAVNKMPGEYFSQLTVRSNDPENQETEIDLTMEVIGYPEIELSANSLTIDDVIVGETGSAFFTITNEGYAPLHVDDISSNNDLFNVTSFSDVLAEGSSTSVTVTFEPIEGGDQTGILTILSDDPEQPSVSISLSGTVLTKPKLVLSRESSIESVDQEETGVTDFNITNEGDMLLFYDITVLEEDFKGMISGISPSTGSVVGGESKGITVSYHSNQLVSGTYEGTLSIESNGSSSPILYQMSIEVLSDPVLSIGNENLEETIKCYPNPSDGEINVIYTISDSNLTDVTIDLFNAQGLLIDHLYSGPTSPGQHELKYSDHLKSGLYFIALRNGSTLQVAKIVVK